MHFTTTFSTVINIYKYTLKNNISLTLLMFLETYLASTFWGGESLRKGGANKKKPGKATPFKKKPFSCPQSHKVYTYQNSLNIMIMTSHNFVIKVVLCFILL